MISQVKWRRVIHTTYKILPLVWKMSPRALIVSHIIMIVQGCLPLVQVYLVAKVVGTTERVIAGELPYIYAVFWLLGQGLKRFYKYYRARRAIKCAADGLSRG